MTGKCWPANAPPASSAGQPLLGDNLDLEKIEAAYDSGVLRLRIPVAERAKPRKIDIQFNQTDGERAAISA